MRRLMISLSAALCALATPAIAAPQCQIVKTLELPVQLVGRRAIVTTKINGKEARFILDSGAFFSTMSQATAAQYGLKLTAAPAGYRLGGVNGSASVMVGTAHDFELGGAKVSDLQFIVGGTDVGSVGLLGQNFLVNYDVEYDFPHGMVRLLKVGDCPGVSAAYWSGDRPVTTVPLSVRVPPRRVHTIGTVTLNGAKVHALFDTGAPASGMTLATAKHAGITPQSPGVTPEGYVTGLGSRSVSAWKGTFTSLDIGGEAIPKPQLRFADISLGDSDMVLGFDFFLSHRILVMRKDRALITYEGGPIFGITPTRALNADGSAINLGARDDSAPTDADGFARQGSVLASQGKFEAALADFDQAVALAPADARYLRLRGQARMANRQPLLGFADIDKAVALDPADADTRMVRAMMKGRSNDPKGALEDLRAADQSLPPSSDKRLALANAFNSLEQPEAALPNFDGWLKFHEEDAHRPEALGGRCWSRIQLHRELDKALSDCNLAVRGRPADSVFLNNRALVRLLRGELPQARVDYDAAVAANPRNALALYGRGVVRRKTGDAAGADADRAAALALQPRIAERATRLGLAAGPE